MPANSQRRRSLRGIRLPDHLAEHAVNGLRNFGPLTYQRIEVGLAQAKQVRSFDRRNARGPRLRIKQRKLSKKLMLFQVTQYSVAIVYPDAACFDDVEAV